VRVYSIFDVMGDFGLMNKFGKGKIAPPNTMPPEETAMDERLTAQQARYLAGPTVEERVVEVLGVIRVEALKKQRRVDLKTDFWSSGGYGDGFVQEQWRLAKKMLENLGYKVTHNSIDNITSLYMYTTVEW
jgi:hypothetical protein